MENMLQLRKLKKICKIYFKQPYDSFYIQGFQNSTVYTVLNMFKYEKGELRTEQHRQSKFSKSANKRLLVSKF